MPAKDYNNYMNEYMKRRYYERRKNIIERLGGECVLCGSVEKLELDHIDPHDKEFGIAKRLASMNEEELEIEVLKLQLLCHACHVDKHRVKEHGTRSMYRHCKCAECKQAQTDYMREYKRKKRASVIQR